MLYFAYGSNLQKRHFARLCPNAQALGPAHLGNYRLIFRFYADIEPVPGATVYGGLWRITGPCEAALDAYENIESGLYVKLRVGVETLNDGPVEALTYRMARTDRAPPEPAYLAMIREGYRDFGLNADGLERAFRETLTQT